MTSVTQGLQQSVRQMKARVTSRSVATGQLSQATFLCFSEASRNVTSFEVGHVDKDFKVRVGSDT